MTIDEQIEILTAHRNGIPVEFSSDGDRWMTFLGSIPNVQRTLHWRIKPEEPKSKIAEGHNPDRLTEGQVGVKDGWRLVSEKENNQFKGFHPAFTCLEMWTSRGWCKGSNGFYLGVRDQTFRTQKPPGYFDNGVPMKKVALTHDDFPLGCQVRTGYADGIVVRRTPGAVSVMCGEYYMSSLVEPEYEGWQRSLDGGKTWLPCYKEVPETE